MSKNLFEIIGVCKGVEESLIISMFLISSPDTSEISELRSDDMDDWCTIIEEGWG